MVEKTKSTQSRGPCAMVGAFLFGSLFADDGTRFRGLWEFWLAECELLNLFSSCCCCSSARATQSSSSSGHRGFLVKLARVASVLLFAASISFFFGSLEFEATTCETNAQIKVCTVKSGGYESTIDTGSSSSSCTTLPAITSILFSTASFVSLAVAQCVKFVGGYAQDLAKPGSALDTACHVLWLAVAAATIPVAYVLSDSLVGDDAFSGGKSAELRMRTILAVTLSTWIEDQGVDLVKVPCTYGVKCIGYAVLGPCGSQNGDQNVNQIVLPQPQGLLAAPGIKQQIKQVATTSAQATANARENTSKRHS